MVTTMCCAYARHAHSYHRTAARELMGLSAVSTEVMVSQGLGDSQRHGGHGQRLVCAAYLHHHTCACAIQRYPSARGKAIRGVPEDAPRWHVDCGPSRAHHTSFEWELHARPSMPVPMQPVGGSGRAEAGANRQLAETNEGAPPITLCKGMLLLTRRFRWIVP
jgi:hypothetical protein